MNDDLDQFLKDFYGKYSPGSYTPEKAARIRQLYGSDYDNLISDLYSKYGQGVSLTPEKVARIKQLYKFEAVAPEATAQKDTGFVAAIQDMVAAAQQPADQPAPADPFINAIKRGSNLAESANLINVEGGTPTEDQLGRVAELQQETAQLPSSASYQRFNEAKSFGDAVSELAKDPAKIIVELTAESLSSLAQYGGPKIAERALQGGALGAAYGSVVPGAGTVTGLTSGASSGVVAGMSEASLGLEYTGAFLESLKEAGVDVNDKASLVKAFQDENVISEARSHGLKKGIPIAIFDLISGGVAGRIVSKPAKSLVGKIGQGALEFAVQGALGGGGEAAGQVISGEELQPGAILGEVFGELGTTPIEASVGAVGQVREAAQSASRETQNALREAEAIVNQQPSASPEGDAIIDSEYADIAKALDAIEIEKEAGPESLMPPSQDQELNLDDSEQTPALDTRIGQFTPSINEENELPNDLKLTPEQAGAMQASVIRNKNLDPQEEFVDGDIKAGKLPKTTITPVAPVKVVESKSPIKENIEEDRKVTQPKVLKESFWETLSKQNTESLELKRSGLVSDIEQYPNDKSRPQNIARLKAIDGELNRRSEEADKTKQDRIVKYTTQLENIKKDKPNKQIKRLEVLNENTLDLPEVNEKVREAQEKLKVIGNEKEFAKQMKSLSPAEKVEAIRLRNTDEALAVPLETLQSAAERDVKDINEGSLDTLKEAWSTIGAYGKSLLSTEVAELEGIYQKTRKAYEKQLEPVFKAREKEQAAQKKESQDRTKVRDNYLTDVAKAVERNTPGQVDLAVKAYQQWRRDNGLPEVSAEEIKKKAGAEYFTNRASKEIAKSLAEEKARERREKELKAEAEKKAKAQEAAKNLKKDLGLSDDADIKLLESTSDLPEGVDVVFSNPRKITYEDLFNRINVIYPYKGKFINSLKALVKLSDAILRKFSKNGVEIYMASPGKTASASGMFIQDKNRSILIVGDWTMGPVDAHELIHLIVSGAINGINIVRSKGTNPRQATNFFYDQVDSIYRGALSKFRDELIEIKRLQELGREVSETQRSLLVALAAYLDQKGHSDFQTIGPKQITALLDNSYNAVERKKVYGFANSDEMLAETFSNPYFMTLMGLLESPSAKQGTESSYFKDLVDSIKEFIKTVVASLRLQLLGNSYLEELTGYMSEIEKKYLNPDVALTDIGDVNLIEADTLYMANKPINRLSPQLKKLMDMLSNRWWKDSTLTSQQEVQNRADKINKLSKKNKLGQADVAYIWGKIEKYRKELAQAKTIQSNSLGYAKKSVPEYKTSKSYKKDVDDFGATDLDQLSIQQVRSFTKGFTDLVQGRIPEQKAYNIVNKDVAKKYLSNLLTIDKKDLAENPGLFIPKKLSIKSLANPATFTNIMAKYKSENGKKLFNTFFGDLLEARTFSQQESNEFLKKLFNVVNKYNLSHADFVRTHMYGVALSTFNDPTKNPVEWADEIQANLQLIELNAANKVTAMNDGVYKGSTKVRVLRELEIAQKLRQDMKDPKNFNTILSKGQEELYDTFREFIETYEQDIARNTEGVWGNTFTPQYNYFPTFALGKVTTGDIGGVDQLVPNKVTNNMWEALTLGKTKSYGKVTGKQSGFVKEKTQPKGYFYDYDLMSVAHKFAPSTLFDLYATRALKSVNLLLNGSGKHSKPVTVKGKSLRNVLTASAVKAFNYQLKSIVGSTSSQVDPDMIEAFKFILRARDSVATSMLASTGQFLVQASSAVPAALLVTPKGFGKAMSVLTGYERMTTDFDGVKDFIDKNGLSIQLRDVLFERFQTIDDIQKEGWRRAVGNATAISERVSSAALRKGDKFAARLVWFSAFFDAGGTLQKPTREAVLAAERMVGILQNMSDVSFSAPLFRSNNMAHRFLIHMLYAFKSFALNSALNTYYSGKYFFNSKEARQIFVANILMAMTYHAASIYLIRPAYTAISESLFGGDSDDEDKNYTKEEYVAANTIWDLAIGQVSPAFFDALSRMAYQEYSKSRAEAQGETFDPYLDSPLYAPRTKEQALAEASGLYGDLAAAGWSVATNTSKQVEESMDLLELEDIDQEIMFIQNMKSLSTILRILPMRGDLRKLLNSYENRLKQEKKGKTGGAGAFGEEPGTEFEIQEYNTDGDFNTSEPTVNE